MAAGIKVALTEGIGALSMARVAGELGVGTMSLYRYVAAKDELLTLMVDTALGPPPPARAGDEDWRAGLTRWAVGVRDAYRRHPWSLRVPISGAAARAQQRRLARERAARARRHAAVRAAEAVDACCCSAASCATTRR